MSDLQPLLGEQPQHQQKKTDKIIVAIASAVVVIVATASAVVVIAIIWGIASFALSHVPPNNKLPRCNQVPALVPTGNSSWIDIFTSDNAYILAASERLAGAVRIPTESYDSTRGVPPPLEGPDPIHEGFEKLHKYLEASLPLVRKHLTRKVINRYALLYTWKGSNESLAPLVLMAHQDTVPVLPDTLDQWTHPPFSGFVDEENDAIWGRGSVDTKPTLVGSLEAIEVLLGRGFSPRKTVYLAFGYDEEISGIEGARLIAEYMERELKLTGKVGMVFDEGLDSLTKTDGIDLAVVNTAEKGYVDYHMTVETPGGHSSIPPLHTGIGLMSQLVNALEANPHPVLLTETNPYLGSIVCTAQHSPNSDPFIRDALAHFDTKSQSLADYLAARSLKDRYRMASSQAIDIIQGGLKINALPELVTVDLNNRVSIDSNIDEFQRIVEKNLRPVAVKYGLNYTFMDFLKKDSVLASYSTPNAIGTATIFGKPTDSPLEPSPISPLHSAAWNMVEGTIHHVYERPGAFGVQTGESRKYIVAPGLMAGNTDTRYFWNLSKNIFRFAPATGGSGYHTINERASIKGYMTAVTFFHELIRNYDQL
ncbi:UNVERIFIED_CONTAM: hypothetical protein HDU68_002208 [Siphonaria sp. JEL0065]|nr:hypothetical protein HDU68_002208 [Siphonaria sp. JEL0065]